MPTAAITIAAGFTQTNDMRIQRFLGTLTINAQTYTAGGLALDSVLLAALLPQSNRPPLRVVLTSQNGLGYIYQRINSSGKLMILQVPPAGSLVTAAPLQEILAGLSLSVVATDVIQFEAQYLRNS